MDKGKPNIRRLTQQELSDYFAEMGEKAFRARQVWDWLWVHHAVNFGELKWSLASIFFDRLSFSREFHWPPS